MKIYAILALLAIGQTALAQTEATVSTSADVISQSPAASLDDAVKGHLAGYYDNGAIRGLQSVNGSPQLIVIDGVPSTTVSLEDIDPTIVEKVEVLKDAAAKALYGPVGAQGVIVVTTKRGNIGDTKVTVSANFALQNPTRKAKMVGGYDYALLRNEALLNSGQAPTFSSEKLAALEAGEGIDNDWRSMFLRDFKTAQRYAIQINGGTQRVRYYVNGGFERTTGIYNTEEHAKYNPSVWSNRFNVTSNIDVTLFPFLSAFVNSSVRINRDNAPGATNLMNAIYTIPNTVEGGMIDGKIVTDPNFPNPIYGMMNYSGVRETSGNHINAAFGLNLDLGFITKGLSLQGILGYNSTYQGLRRGNYDFTRYVRNEQGELEIMGTNVESVLSWSKSSTSLYFMNFQGILDYHRNFGANFVSARLSYLSEDKISGSTAPGWLLPYSRIQLGGQAKYGYDNRYYVQFDFTHAGTEQLPKGNQFHFSPTFSAAWNLGNEAFMREIDWINRANLRWSYGILQYDNLTNFNSRYLYASELRQANGGGYIAGIFSGATITEGPLGNPFISWEKRYEQNYGIDLTLFDNLSISLDYYRTHLHNMLCVDQLIPDAGGYTSSKRPYANIGQTRNQGFEVSARYHNELSCGLGITGSVDLAWNRNRVIYAGDINFAEMGYAYPTRVSDYSIGQVFGYIVDTDNGNGFFNSQEEIDNCGLRYQGVAPRPGDLRYKDLNEDGVIDQCDMAPLDGVKNMPSFSYGAGVNLTYRGFDLGIFLQGETGRNRVCSGLGVFENVSQGVYLDIHRHAWTEERLLAGEEILYPALTANSSSSLQDNSFFTTKADFIRLKNLTFGYSLPKSVLSKIYLDNLRVYFAAENLFTATNMKFKGFDPEATGIDDFLYRSFSIGLNFNF